MMLNPMAAGRPEPQWTQYQPGSDFEDCEYRVEEREILGVKQKYIMIRGALLIHTRTSIDMPAGVNVDYPFNYAGFVIEYIKRSSKVEFFADICTVDNGYSNSINFPNSFGAGSKFLIFARVK